MIIGVPKETKPDEYRVSLPPDKVDLLVRSGHVVLVQADAGVGADFSDEEYDAVGGIVVSTAQDLFEQAKLIVKVKEPQPSEYEFLNSDHILFCYLHLAPDPELARALISAKVAGVAYETVEEDGGRLPLLYPMSEIAGKLAPQIAARFLQSPFGGRGRLLSGVPGTEPCRVVVVGGGTVGLNAAQMARSLGADVTIVDLDLDRLRYIDQMSDGAIRTRYSTPSVLSKLLSTADIAVGAVLIPGALAPRVITREMVADMPDRSVVLDVSIDQGGSIEGIRATTVSDPTYVADGVIHCAIPNIPGMVANTSSISLSNATYPYVLKLANWRFDVAVRRDQAIARGVNTLKGHVTYPAVADSLEEEYVPVHEVLGA